jgi:hypothetical protein
MKYREEAQQKHSQEWEQIQKQYPAFARAHLGQQAILMEAVYRGDRLIARRMSRLLRRSDIATLFGAFWERQRRIQVELEEISPEVLENVNPLLACITEKNKDPARCFDLSRGWFEDPFAGGKTPVET